jgi:DNA-binding FadR family transcriptional regulator
VESPATTTALLRALHEATGPIGARQVREALRCDGMELSESTIARRLRDLDSDGLTIQIGTNGRVLTVKGQEFLSDVLRGNQSADRLRRASQVRTIEDVLHLLKARRAIEPEAVYDIADHATADDLHDLHKLVIEHEERLTQEGKIPRQTALGFHRMIAGLTRNPLVQAMLAVVLDESLDHVEAALDVIIETHHTDKAGICEHSAILHAITARDADKAAQAMREHLTRLIAEVEAFAVEYDPAILDRLLVWTRSATG